MTHAIPLDDGFRQPAEWAPHDACWVAWPSHADLWGDELAAAREAFVALCRGIADPDPATGASRGERLEVLVLDAAGEAEARAALEGLGARFHRIPFGDIWLRDTAPIFLTGDGGLAAACFRFNGWGDRYRLPGDESVAGRVARVSGAEVVYELPWVLEGGAVDVDGEGTALTTRQCLLNPNRRGRPADADEAAMTARLCQGLGQQAVIWLDDGLANDHTDGHVDTVARFVAPGRVVCMAPAGDGDPNREALRAIERTLRAATDAAGRRLEVVTVPSPGAVLDDDGEPMPASYVNFYVANTTVVVPVYGVPQDARAVETIAGLFPERRVVPVEARAILAGGGAFHCITQQQPRRPTP